FETMGIALVRGRAIDGRDQAGSPPVVVINRAMAQRYWPNVDPIGRHVSFHASTGIAAHTATVVGVAGDIRHNRLEEMGESQIYFAFAQHPIPFATLAVRTAGEPIGMADTVRRAVWSVDRDQPVWKVRTMESLLDAYVSPRRMLSLVMTGFALFALGLA